MHALSPCIVYTANTFLQHVTPCVWVKCPITHMCIQTVDLKGASENAAVYVLEERPGLRYPMFLPPQPLLVLVPTCIVSNITPRGHLSHFLQLSQWSCLLTLTDEYLLHNNTYSTYYCEQILKYFNNCGPWTQFSHSIHIRTPWQWHIRYNTFCTHTPTHTSWNWKHSTGNITVH